MTPEQEAKLRADFDDMLRPEPLCEELEGCVRDLPTTLQSGQHEARAITVLHHPFVVAAPYHTALNRQYNLQLQAKLESARIAAETRDWSTYVVLHERPYRYAAFQTLVERKQLTDPMYWQLLAQVWVDCEGLCYSEGKAELVPLFLSRRSGKRHLMHPEEHAELAKLPRRVPVFRGAGPTSDPRKGMSWTLDRNVALMFAKRYRRKELPGRILTGYVERSLVLAFFNRRKEAELVLDPDTVQELAAEPVQPE